MPLAYGYEEIRIMYRDARDKQEQIDILTQLCLVSRKAILKILSGDNSVEPPFKWTPDKEKALFEMHSQGLKPRQIARHFGIPVNVINNKLWKKRRS